MKRQDAAFLRRVPLVAGLTLFAWGIYGETLVWDPNPESNIGGYRVYYGEAGTPPTEIDVGNTTSRQFSNLEAGHSYFFYVTAYNTEGAESAPSDTLNYTKPPPGGNQPPTVQLTSPSDGATFPAPATITLNANAADADGTIVRVNFFSNGTLIGYDSTSPYSFTMNNVGPGNYELSAQAMDNEPSLSAPSVVNVSVGTSPNQPPTVQLTSPSDGATFPAPATITLNANAADADGTVTRVNFFSNGTLIGSDTTSPFSFTINNVGPGNYELSARAIDNDSSASAPSVVNVTVTSVANQPPTVQLTSPSDGATFPAPATITMNANAADADGTVMRVNFFSNGTMVGYDSASPYSFTMNNVGAGSYELSARAIDNDSSASAPSVVNVTVGGSQGPEISSIPDQTVQEDSAGATVNFTVRDADTPAGSLNLSASSSNPALIANGALIFGGSGTNRTLALRPQANQFGTARITVSVSDGQASASTGFDVLVTPVNDMPLISDVPDQSIAVSETTGPLPVTISDLETPSGSLVLTAQSSNTQLVPQSGLVLGGSGGNRTITVRPANNRSGEVVITLAVSDGHQTRSSAFRLTVSGYRVAGTWLNVPLANQPGRCILEFDATPLSGALDSQMGLSDGPATGFGSLATAIRFNPFGSIQARNGLMWGARLPVPYQANAKYHFRLEVNLGTRLYSVYVTPQGGSEITLARNYFFAAEQPFVRELNNFGGRTSSGGSVIVDGISIRAALEAPSEALEEIVPVSTSAGLQSYQEVNGATKLSVSFGILWEQLTDPHTVVDFSNAAGEPSAFLWYSGGQLRVTHGTASGGAPLLLEAQTEYNLWVDWEAGSGGDGTMALYISETDIKPSAPLVSLEEGTGGAVERVYFGGAAPDSPAIVFEGIEVTGNGSGAGFGE